MAARVSVVEVNSSQEIDRAIDTWIIQGYTLANRTPDGATMVKPKQFSVLWAVIGFVICVLPLLIYLIVYAAETDKVVEIRVRNRGADTASYRASAPAPVLAVTQRGPLAVGRSDRLAYLAVQTGPGKGSSHQLGSTTDIGRDSEVNQIVLDDPHVSAYHGRIRVEDGVYVFHDMASSGGSWQILPNGERRRITGPLRLMHGDIIELGRTRLSFMQPPRQGGR